ncbi:MAG: 2Fe-2S iron-sulfur cluster binding domain-containing protein [Oscillospiraceae bacterium]|jgi:NADP-reducing hydrogenase subunit HndD|nr:2Fe-2S iron-sulfur cluster binding domain-containing protein [Oscillospiraceae bacterium]
METVTLKINNIPVTVPRDTTIIEAARQAGISIPTLCYLKGINEIGACRMCLVEVKGARSFAAACVQPVGEGMEVFTNTPELIKNRKNTLELVLSTHDKKCLSCSRSGDCELQRLSREYGIEDENKFEGEKNHYELDASAAHMVRDNNKCILCRRCVAACANVQGIGVIGPNQRGFKAHIASAFEMDLADTSCVSCGQCITACPVGALYEKDVTDEVFAAINDPKKIVIVQTAPAVRTALGEPFGLPIGTNVKGRMAAAIRRLGVDKVFDTDFSADLTIMEEANEFIERVKNGGVLPMITSCSPGWVKFCEHYYPDMIENLSTCKSPQQMFGAIVKTYYAEKNNIDPKDIYLVSVMPCTAKKFERGRDDQAAAGVPDIDAVLTTRELAKMIKKAGLMFAELPDEEFDLPLGIGSGAGAIFGATGGVMEAALRTAVETLTDTKLEGEALDFKEVRGIEGIKEAAYKVGDLEVKVAVASGLANARKLLDAVKAGEAKYDFIEIMACPGGCVNGGGQPIVQAPVRNAKDIRTLRAKVLYDEDLNLPYRKSHDNPVIKELYETYLEKPGSHKAHEILHTSYVKRGL